jgi:hypothetical protein
VPVAQERFREGLHVLVHIDGGEVGVVVQVDDAGVGREDDGVARAVRAEDVVGGELWSEVERFVGGGETPGIGRFEAQERSGFPWEAHFGEEPDSGGGQADVLKGPGREAEEGAFGLFPLGSELVEGRGHGPGLLKARRGYERWGGSGAGRAREEPRPGLFSSGPIWVLLWLPRSLGPEAFAPWPWTRPPVSRAEDQGVPRSRCGRIWQSSHAHFMGDECGSIAHAIGSPDPEESLAAGDLRGRLGA